MAGQHRPSTVADTVFCRSPLVMSIDTMYCRGEVVRSSSALVSSSRFRYPPRLSDAWQPRRRRTTSAECSPRLLRVAPPAASHLNSLLAVVACHCRCRRRRGAREPGVALVPATQLAREGALVPARRLREGFLREAHVAATPDAEARPPAEETARTGDGGWGRLDREPGWGAAGSVVDAAIGTGTAGRTAGDTATGTAVGTATPAPVTPPALLPATPPAMPSAPPPTRNPIWGPATRWRLHSAGGRSSASR